MLEHVQWLSSATVVMVVIYQMCYMTTFFDTDVLKVISSKNMLEQKNNQTNKAKQKLKSQKTGSSLTLKVFVLTSVNLDMNYMQTWNLYHKSFLPAPQNVSLLLRIPQ